MTLKIKKTTLKEAKRKTKQISEEKEAAIFEVETGVTCQLENKERKKEKQELKWKQRKKEKKEEKNKSKSIGKRPIKRSGMFEVERSVT